MTRALLRLIGWLGLMLWPLAAALGAEAPSPVRLWHSYRDAEKTALELLVGEWNRGHPETPVELLAVPYDAYANKLTSAIPHGHGPDLFIAAHERIGDWVGAGLISPWPEADDPLLSDGMFLEPTVEAVRFSGRIWGLPLAFKNVAMIVNTDLTGEGIPRTTDDLLRFCQAFRSQHPDKFCLAYEAGSFYHHAGWLFGFGGRLFDPDGRPSLTDPGIASSMRFVADLTRMGYVPEEPNAALVGQLFNDGRAAIVLNGPWFLGDIRPGLSFAVHPWPVVSPTGRPAKPFLTVEAIFISSKSGRSSDALEIARYLAGPVGAGRRAREGRQSVALLPGRFENSDDPNVRAFQSLAGQTEVMPNLPVMRSVWEPASIALRKSLRGGVAPDEALRAAQTQLRLVLRPPPEGKAPWAYIALALATALALLVWAARAIRRSETRIALRQGITAYLFIFPAALSMLLLVFIPFVVGIAVSLFSHQAGEYRFVGFSNFISILTSEGTGVFEPMSFYYTLVVTVIWTVANVALHVLIGFSLAMLLRDPWMRLRGVYRVLLIVPWAVPNYITALIWKGMFHKQFGAINGILTALDLEPVSWFSSFATAFCANLVTNTWLGFPFMMVVTLGALQSIPRELEEAAECDGAGRWLRLRHVILPLVKPVLLPSVILGSVWTFNMFNIIYLVSGGEPDGATEILVSEAYKWAFNRQEQYGYAAAYAALIFLFLLLYNRSVRRLAKET